jgi:hypothetical protein
MFRRVEERTETLSTASNVCRPPGVIEPMTKGAGKSNMFASLVQAWAAKAAATAAT